MFVWQEGGRMGLLVCGRWCGDVEMGGGRRLDVWVGMMARGWMKDGREGQGRGD